MKKVLLKYNTLIDFINNIVGYILAFLLLVMSVLIFWQVFSRFLIGNSLTFSEEISRFAMIWLTLLGSAYAYRKGMLISVDLLDNILKGKIASLINYLIYVLSALFAMVLIYYGFEMSSRVSLQTAPSTSISMIWPYLAIPISGILIVLNSIALIVDEFFSERSQGL